MRISGGDAKGRSIKPPKHGGVRPTSDKVREALFSILGGAVDGAAFLELYAGTGAVGIEALSRGATRAVFVDSSQKSVRLIRENLGALGYREKAAVAGRDVLVFLKKTARELGPFDVVFVDPPYHTGEGEKTLDALGGSGGDILSGGAAVVYEHIKKHAAPDTAGRLVKRRDYTYGDTVLSVYEAGGAGETGGEALP
ncbi:MAG TPA: 16S rRNA (guanine(966)-N(2))-methyltransferase RsmD [Nitrospirota bacterium]